jgi:hypothetical protein
MDKTTNKKLVGKKYKITILDDEPYKTIGRPPKVIDKTATHKQCRRKNCGKIKPFSEFHKNKQTADGYHDWCKVCRLKLNAKWRDQNRDKIQAYNRSHYKSATVKKREIKRGRISSI